MNIALVSCNNLPGWEADDLPLIRSLESKGATVSRPSWTEDIDWNQFDISVIRTTWDYHSCIGDFLHWTQRVPRLYNNARIVKWNVHKSYLRELEGDGVKIAPTVWLPKESTSDVVQIMNELGTTNGFIKPQVGACASDTFRFTASQFDEAQIFLNKQQHQDMMVQPYIKSVETEGELTSVFIDGAFTHGVQKIPVEGDYRVQDDFGASDHSYTFSNGEIEEMHRILTVVPEQESLLYARFDYLRDSDGTLLLNELELVEPSLFFRHCENSAILFAEAIIKKAMMA